MRSPRSSSTPTRIGAWAAVTSKTRLPFDCDFGARGGCLGGDRLSIGGAALAARLVARRGDQSIDRARELVALR